MICHMGKGLKLLQDLSGCAEGEHNITLVDKDVSTPDGLAVDWVHQLLFWTDTGLDQVLKLIKLHRPHLSVLS